MKKKFLLLISVMAVIGAYAQTETKSYSLRQCIDYALTNNTSVKNATIDEYVSKLKVQEYIGQGMPQVNGTASISASDPLRRMFLRPNSQFLGGANSEVETIPNIFQLQNTGDLGMNFSQILFSTSYFVGLKAAKTFQELSVLSKENSKVQVIENVSKAYWLTLINIERANLFNANIARVDSLLKETKALNKSGLAERIDVDRLEVSYNNLMTERSKLDNMLLISYIMLKYQMNMPIEENLLLSDKLETLSAEQTTSADEKVELSNRIEHKLLSKQLALDNLYHKNSSLSFLPTLTFNGSLGVFTQSIDMDFHYKSHPWYYYGNYGLNLNVNLFSGWGKIRKIQMARLAVDKSSNNLKQFEQTAIMQVKTSEINLKNSQKALEIQKRNMELAKEVARVTKVKFTSGVGSNIEVITAESSLKESQVNYYNALYDTMVYKIEYDKALGRLK